MLSPLPEGLVPALGPGVGLEGLVHPGSDDGDAAVGESFEVQIQRRDYGHAFSVAAQTVTRPFSFSRSNMILMASSDCSMPYARRPRRIAASSVVPLPA